MAEMQDSWKDVKTKAEALGLKLKLHLEQEADESNTTSKPGETKAALDELGNKLQDAFTSFGNAAKDPAIHADVKNVGSSLRDALVDTFSTVGGEVGEQLKKAGDKANEFRNEQGDDQSPQDSDTKAE